MVILLYEKKLISIFHIVKALFHFNGGSKAFIERITSELWHRKLLKNNSTVVESLLATLVHVPNANGGLLSFSQLCPKYNPKTAKYEKI